MRHSRMCSTLAAVAEAAGLTREGTYKALRPSSKPRSETLAALLDALGRTIKIVPKVSLDKSDAQAA